MNDCPKAEYRDRLPELVHERLDERERAAVMAHVAECADCRAEVELLRRVRVVLAVGSRLDIDRIVRALPVPGARVIVPKPWRRTLLDWRIAAAAVFVLAGGAFVATHLRGDVSSGAAVATTRAATETDRAVRTAPSASSAAIPGTAVPERVADASSDSELGVGGGLSDLTPSELTTLLGEIEHLDALPQMEPDVGTVSSETPGESP